MQDRDRSIREGALAGFTDAGRLVYSRLSLEHLEEVAQAFGFDLDTPWRQLPRAAQKVVLFGSGSRKFQFRWRKGGSHFRTEGKDQRSFPLESSGHRR